MLELVMYEAWRTWRNNQDRTRAPASDEVWHVRLDEKKAEPAARPLEDSIHLPVPGPRPLRKSA